jgi:hypothetical protein
MAAPHLSNSGEAIIGPSKLQAPNFSGVPCFMVRNPLMAAASPADCSWRKPM